MALLSLGAGLSIVLAHVLIIGSDESDDALLALVANINTDEHGLVGDFWAEVHSPEITAELGIDLSDNVQIDSVVISVDSLACHKLRDNGVVRVNFIFNGGVEVLLSQAIRDDDKEELDHRGRWYIWLCGGHGPFLASFGFYIHIILEIGVNGVLEVLDLGSVMKRNNVTVFNKNVQTILL